MTFDEEICSYVLKITDLETYMSYHWTVVLDQDLNKNYNCGSNNCTFRTSSGRIIAILNTILIFNYIYY